MDKRFSHVVALLIVASAILAACGGGGRGGDPAATIQEAFRRMEAKQFDKIAELACEAKRADLAETLDFGAAMSQALPGIDAQQVLDSLSIKVANLDVKEVSRSGNEAVYHVKGDLTMTFDPEKFKPILKEVLKSQGLGDMDDATLDSFLGPMLEQAQQATAIDDDVNMVNEGGKWLICDNLVTP